MSTSSSSFPKPGVVARRSEITCSNAGGSEFASSVSAVSAIGGWEREASAAGWDGWCGLFGFGLGDFFLFPMRDGSTLPVRIFSYKFPDLEKKKKKQQNSVTIHLSPKMLPLK